MPLYWDEKTLLLKTETSYGVDATPTGAANAILATDVRLSPMEGQDVDRALEMPWMGASGTIPTGLHAKLSFKVELKGSGTAGSAPAFGPVLKALGFAEVIAAGASVTYSRVSKNHSSATICLNIAGTLYKILGARGTGTLRVNAQGIVYLEAELTGLFVQPSSQALPTVTLGTQLSQFPQVATSANTPTFTVDATALVLRSLALNLGNTVSTRFLIGSESVIIEKISEMIDFTVEAVPLATLNPYALAAAGGLVPLSLVHGTGAGKICTLTVPRLQLQRPAGLEQQNRIVEWPLRGVPLPDTGNDQLTLAFT
ncbi:phage tail tube protein [Gemmobacter caeni]|uniref:Uncharacterized protein n=1 Tax=Gemmobacter caeni TaxID=589035 RepID=A0A2T6A045_9RHOB|nr:phage tail tube protein [Gemmobacter caeni]PTX37163.1 hypothetical protein C8N34_1538 [Gemmobacter caeni]